MKVKKQCCGCGCGGKPKKGNKYILGHNSKGSNNPNYGKFGEDSPNYGKQRSFETRMKMSESSPKYWLGKKNKKSLSEEQKKRQAESISKSLRGEPIKFDVLRKLKRCEASARREGLGFIPLNTPFRGCVRHHIDRNAVIFMDASVHAHYKHSLKKPKSMVLINSIAISYMDTEEDYEMLIDSMNGWDK